MRLGPAQVLQDHGHARAAHRAHQQGGKHRRAEGAGAHRGHGTAIRGRPALHVPHPASHQEPLRQHVGTGHLRDAAGRAARGAEPFGNAAIAQPRGAERRGHRLGHRGHTPLPHRGAGPGQLSGLRQPATLQHGLRLAKAQHAAGRAGETGGLQADAKGRVPQHRGGIAGERPGHRPSGHLVHPVVQRGHGHRPARVHDGRSGSQRRDTPHQPAGTTHHGGGEAGLPENARARLPRRQHQPEESQHRTGTGTQGGGSLPGAVRVRSTRI